MQEQTIEQIITIDYALNLAETGLSMLPYIAIGLGLLAAAFAAYYFLFHKRGRSIFHKTYRSAHRFNGFGAFLFLALSFAALSITMPMVQAAPTLSLNTGKKLTVTIPKGGGTATTTTTMTTSTANTTGYTLTAQLTEPEEGIDISLKGGDITTSTQLVAGATPLSLKTTTTANATDPDTTTATLSFTVDSTVKPGTKTLKLVYKATDNTNNGNNGEGDPDGQNTTPSAPLTMQSLTQDYCQNHMTIYNGTNEEAILTLQDNRGATPTDYRTYQVAKLADNKCWMLDNLKLGSTTDTTTLTPADSNVSSNFTLPQVGGNNTLDYDNPRVYGPVPGDTGSGATNYGYLYNWSAATAGESQASITSGNAAHSICAKGWRLPVGGAYNSGVGDFADLDRAFGGTGMPAWSGSGETNIAQWQHAGPFKGVFAGSWWEGFYGQGDWGYLWSSSAYPDWSGSAFGANFAADDVYPGNYSDRFDGFGVRCLLN
ncbi:MAG TPA: FISUMP domain-containing protein [Candidatus Saccharibacteria bacterium]|nr:FISUMP domain-containing protein [Candidatus Saccharibacteria bacterium]HMR38053.1 FISUMP domain-containing protein [Candidatus Saccharibacteria bacterium]